MAFQLNHSTYLALTLEEAREAALNGDKAIGAVLVAPDGQVVARGRNRRHSLNSHLQHAELQLLFNHQQLLHEYDGKLTLYSSLEPCIMCMATAITARICRIVWALDDPYLGWHVGLNLAVYPKEKIEIEMIAEPDPLMREMSMNLLIQGFSEAEKLKMLAHINSRESINVKPS